MTHTRSLDLASSRRYESLHRPVPAQQRPALLKCFRDGVLTPGFAFDHVTHDRWDNLLRGRMTDLITPMDTPPLIYRFIG